jgi:hypothetical protein
MCKRCCIRSVNIVVVTPVIDENGDYRYDGPPADTILTEADRAFFKKCEEANDMAAGWPGNWPKR